jgi:hypothetical protein
MTVLHAPALVLATLFGAFGTIQTVHAASPFGGTLCQDPKPGTKEQPKQDPKPAPTKLDPALEAEKEKLRMKDVEAWKKQQVKSLDQVMDPKKTTLAIELPATITDAEKTKVTELLQTAKEAGSGARRGKSLRQMAKIGGGYPALVILINHLREIDYKDPDSAAFGMEINTTLSDITGGVNTGYVAIPIGEPMDPRMAQWNARTVEQWLNSLRGEGPWTSREKFDTYVAKRKAKKESELEQEGGGTGKEEPKKKPEEAKKP